MYTKVLNHLAFKYPEGTIVNINEYNLRAQVLGVYKDKDMYGKTKFFYKCIYKTLSESNLYQTNINFFNQSQLSLIANNIKQLDKKFVCKCGEVISKKYMDFNDKYINLCERCLTKNYRKSVLNNKRYPIKLLFGTGHVYIPLTERKNYYICEACNKYMSIECKDSHICSMRGEIQSYHTNNFLKFYKDKSEVNPRYFGIEHETNKRSNFDNENNLNDIARDVMKEFPQVNIQFDSSVSGFEAIFQPMTLKAWQKFNLSKYLGLLDGLTGSEGSGFHVHVNRESVNKLTIYKINEFFRINKRLILKIFERTEEELQWCLFTERDMNKGYYKTNYMRGDKYRMVNTSKESTIEFRGFRSTITAYKFLARIEFIDFLLNYFDKTASYDFINFFNAGLNAKKYKHLMRYFNTIQKKLFS